MRTTLGWIAFAIVYCAAGAWAEEVPFDASLMQAQKDFDGARELYRGGKYPEATILVKRALQIWEKIFGAQHEKVAVALDFLCGLHLSQGFYITAEQLCQRASEIRGAILGNKHPAVAQSLSHLARVYESQGFYRRAEALYLRAQRIQEVVLGNNHPAVASLLNNIAELYRKQGRYEVAEPLYQRSLQILGATLGENHPDFAAILNNLGELYRNQGRYELAESRYQRSLQIMDKGSEKNNPNNGTLLNNLALLYEERGAYEQAEPLCQRAIQIREAALGKSHPDVAQSLNNLATLYEAQGFYERAEGLYQRSLQICETALGKSHPDVARSLNNLASLYKTQGYYDRSLPLYQRALLIDKVALGANHPHIAALLGNLADLYQEKGGYKHAELLYRRGLQIREAVLGKNHRDVATSLSKIAKLYVIQGKYERAEPAYHRALQIREATLGKEHPDVAAVLNDIGLLRMHQNRSGSALPLLERSFAISEQRLRREALSFSEARLVGFLNLLRRQDETFYNLLYEQTRDATVRYLALRVALLHKGRSSDEISDASRIIYRNLGQVDREAFQRLRALRTQLAALSFSGPGQLSPTDYQARLKDLEDKGDTLEAELAQRSSILRSQQQLPTPADILTRVAAALPPDGALIEIIAFAAHPFVPPPGIAPTQIPSTPVYFALILLPDGDIHVAPLGPAATIDSGITRLREALAHRDASYINTAQELYRLVFAPIAPLLDKQRRLFIAPDGQLGLVPWAALHDGNRFLMDTFDLSYLTSGRDLLPRPADIPSSHSVVVFADPDFAAVTSTDNARGGDSAIPSASTPLERSFSLERFFTRQQSLLQSRPWMPLPGARQEAEIIHNIWPQAQLFVGPAATKQALLQIATPGILHIATHGNFLDDADTSSSTRGIAGTGELSGKGPAQRPPDPLLRSYLVLAGANPPATSSDKPAQPHLEDTLVTALELAGMNLWGTQLVVLSACDTGQGDAKIGQGVYGLRRAFAVAGAETLVTSLWKVDDTTTRELMETYYRDLLDGQGRAAAMQAAMREVRERHPHPYDWAPFIVVGNGAPLRGLSPMHP